MTHRTLTWPGLGDVRNETSEVDDDLTVGAVRCVPFTQYVDLRSISELGECATEVPCEVCVTPLFRDLPCRWPDLDPHQGGGLACLGRIEQCLGEPRVRVALEHDVPEPSNRGLPEFVIAEEPVELLP